MSIYFMVEWEHKNFLTHVFHLQWVDQIPSFKDHVPNIGEAYIFVGNKFGEEGEVWRGGGAWFRGSSILASS